MQDEICSLILRSNASIMRVVMVSDQGAQTSSKPGRPEIDSIDTAPEIVRFHVTDLLEGYAYDLADHGSFRSLIFQISDAKLIVDIDAQADVASLAEDIARLAGNQVILDDLSMISCTSELRQRRTM